MRDAELLAALRHHEEQRRRLYAEELRLIAEMDSRGIAGPMGYSGTGAIVREILHLNTGDVRRIVAHAKALHASHSPTGATIEADLPATAEVLSEGSIAPEHVETIRTALTSLPAAISAEDRAHAEKILLETARDYEPRFVARLGREIHNRLDPDGAEPPEHDPANPRRRLDLQEHRNGRLSGSFDLDPETGALFANLIGSRSAPRSSEEGPDTRGKSERQGDAFADILVTAAGCPDGPTEAGEPVTLLVGTTLDSLKNNVGHGLVDGYLKLSVTEVRRMACDCHAAPAVYGNQGEILDIGRKSRTIPLAIRRALILRDKGCTFPGCDRKAKWCHGHHVQHWAEGGPTALNNLALLCHHHHRVIHHTEWDITMVNGIPWFLPPPHVDPDRKPRRNPLHLNKISLTTLITDPWSSDAQRQPPAPDYPAVPVHAMAS